MLGPQIEEGRGKRTGRRLISSNPLKVEASAEENAAFLGIEGLSIITYTATVKPDGSIHGEGDGFFSTPQGDTMTWRGIGVGRFVEGGGIYYCGSLSFSTASERLAKLNGVSGVFQWEIDAEGNTRSRIWELAPAGVSQAKAEPGKTQAQAAQAKQAAN
jgi:hypothetical protein